MGTYAISARPNIGPNWNASPDGSAASINLSSLSYISVQMYYWLNSSREVLRQE